MLLGHPDLRHDAREVFFAARRHLPRRQSVDALDVVLATLHLQHLPLAPAVGIDHHKLRFRRPFPPETDQEPAVLRHPHRRRPETRRRSPAAPARAAGRPGCAGRRDARRCRRRRAPDRTGAARRASAGEDGPHHRHSGVRDSRSPGSPGSPACAVRAEEVRENPANEWQPVAMHVGHVAAASRVAAARRDAGLGVSVPGHGRRAVPGAPSRCLIAHVHAPFPVDESIIGPCVTPHPNSSRTWYGLRKIVRDSTCRRD